MVINQLAPIFVAFSVPERGLPEIRQYMADGPPLVVEASVAGASREPARGKLTFVNNAVDPTTGSILLKAEFPNQDLGLWPGEFVHVSVTLTTRLGVLVVPAAAVQSGQKGDYVLVVKPDQTAEMRPVRCGPRLDGQGDHRERAGAGETVVTDGHLRVVPGAKVSIKADLESALGRPGNEHPRTLHPPAGDDVPGDAGDPDLRHPRISAAADQRAAQCRLPHRFGLRVSSRVPARKPWPPPWPPRSRSSSRRSPGSARCRRRAPWARPASRSSSIFRATSTRRPRTCRRPSPRHMISRRRCRPLPPIPR